MSRRSLVLACLGLCVAVSVAVACGPDFPWQLLDDRTATLKATPANSFAYEAAHLAPPPADMLQAVEVTDAWEEHALDQARAKAEAVGLTPAQAAQIARMRRAPNGEVAFALGTGLPEAVRHYTAGAVAFHHGDAAGAARHFEAAAQQGASPTALRATWAAYMRARLHVLAGETGPAAAAFAATRALALAGAPDPFGLAVASLGEEARLHLDAAQALVGDGDPPPAYAAELGAAVGLYADQAAHGSGEGVESLRMVAEDLLGIGTDRNAVKLRAAVHVPLVQRLLVAYALARVEDDPPADNAKTPQPNPLLGVLVDAIQAVGGDPPGADRLAALCYRTGRYDLAAQLAGKAVGPLAAWVRAKLALQRGDLVGAAAAYAEAAHAFPDAADAPLDGANRRLVVGERGTLTLARGDYVEALAQLYPVADAYWGDVAYIAERVLTVDELKHFVDASVPAPAAPVTDGPRGGDVPNWLVSDPAAQLRDLLARRLVRQERYQEALPYFHGVADTVFSDPAIRGHVVAYAAARQAGTALWWRVERARAWYAAAVLARRFGMEMMGYEAAPDYFAISGAFGTGLGQTRPGDAFVSTAERSRFAASEPLPDLRFHYRFLAVEHASLAADLLPPRSQAFAAVLCNATNWMLDTADKLDTPDGKDNPALVRVHALYGRYVREGAHMDWATHFGHDCPQPDFEAAERTARRQILRDARAVEREHRPLILLAMGGAAVLGLMCFAMHWHTKRMTG
ncbi:MAG: hypothetical protein P4L71_19905 [Acetobacteraceae bacterium]|nr:hypothetical protein [Acetobacteraceae bacterium]